jgi:hypothetical protein
MAIHLLKVERDRGFALARPMLRRRDDGGVTRALRDARLTPRAP